MKTIVKQIEISESTTIDGTTIVDAQIIKHHTTFGDKDIYWNSLDISVCPRVDTFMESVVNIQNIDSKSLYQLSKMFLTLADALDNKHE